jgi:hypothetical protein
MFFQFYDNNLHSFLLGKIESYSVKTISKKQHYLILKLDGTEKWLVYNEYKNLVSDVQGLHETLNDYYEKVMDAERGAKDNVMGYNTCGDGVGTEEGPADEYEDEPEDRARPMGFSPNKINC